MNLIDKLKEECKKNKKRIILPEGNNKDVLEAAKYILKEDIADLIILGNKVEDELLNKAEWIDPKTSSLIEEYTTRLYELRKDKGMTLELANNLLLNEYMYFSCMLVLDNKADGIVNGKTTSSLLKNENISFFRSLNIFSITKL